VRTLP